MITSIMTTSIDIKEPRALQVSPSPVAQQWERVAEGRVRALKRHPHPPFGHLLPQAGEGEFSEMGSLT
jgi:hypothetical protein